MKKAKQNFDKVIDVATLIMIGAILISMLFGYEPSIRLMFLTILLTIFYAYSRLKYYITKAVEFKINKNDLNFSRYERRK